LFGCRRLYTVPAKMNVDHEPQYIRECTGNTAEQIDRRRALFRDIDGDFYDSKAGALGPNDQLAGEHILFDHAIFEDRKQRRASECLDAMCVRAAKTERYA
jgi:hypothetical protein